MKPLMSVGIVLIVIRVIALAYGGFSFTTSEKVAEVGPLKIEKDKTRSVALPPVLGGLAFEQWSTFSQMSSGVVSTHPSLSEEIKG